LHFSDGNIAEEVGLADPLKTKYNRKRWVNCHAAKNKKKGRFSGNLLLKGEVASGKHPRGTKAAHRNVEHTGNQAQRIKVCVTGGEIEKKIAQEGEESKDGRDNSGSRKTDCTANSP